MEFYSIDKIKNSNSFYYFSANTLINNDLLLFFSKGEKKELHLDEIYMLQTNIEDKLEIILCCTGKNFHIKCKSPEEKRMYYFYINLYKYTYNTYIKIYKQLTDETKKYHVKEFKTNLNLFLKKEIYYEMINNLNKNLFDLNDLREMICYKLNKLFSDSLFETENNLETLTTTNPNLISKLKSIIEQISISITNDYKVIMKLILV